MLTSSDPHFLNGLRKRVLRRTSDPYDNGGREQLLVTRLELITQIDCLLMRSHQLVRNRLLTISLLPGLSQLVGALHVHFRDLPLDQIQTFCVIERPEMHRDR